MSGCPRARACRVGASPLTVITTYQVLPAGRPAFAVLMEQLNRRREGAIRVGLYADLADPARLVEYFMVESWEEYE